MRGIALGFALLTLAACDGGGDPVEQALRETATANHSAVVKETATVEPVATQDQKRVADLVADNRDTLAKARAVVRETNDAEIRRMAQASIDARTREIAELEAWTPAPAAPE